jgi:DNA-binding transcriptional LysR family regulator
LRPRQRFVSSLSRSEDDKPVQPEWEEITGGKRVRYLEWAFREEKMLATNLGEGLTINLNLLQVFLHVADHRSFKRAAEACHRSHSVVSSQIKSLEDQLSVHLFYRTTRSVDLTPEGEHLVEIARRLIDGARDGLSSIQSRRQHSDRNTSVACSISLAGLFIPPAIKMFSERHPDMRVSVSEMSLAKMAPGIIDGEFDFGVAAQYPCHDALEFKPLAADPLVAIIPKTLPQSTLGSISLEELCSMPLLLTTVESVTQSIFRAATKAKGLELRKRFNGAIQPSLLLPLVNAGLGATVLTLAGKLWDPYPDVAMVPIEEPSLSRIISIVTPRGRKLTGASKHFSKLLQAEVLRWKARSETLSNA